MVRTTLLPLGLGHQREIRGPKECRLKLVKELDSFFYIYKDDEEARHFGGKVASIFFGRTFMTSSYVYIYMYIYAYIYIYIHMCRYIYNITLYTLI